MLFGFLGWLEEHSFAEEKVELLFEAQGLKLLFVDPRPRNLHEALIRNIDASAHCGSDQLGGYAVLEFDPEDWRRCGAWYAGSLPCVRLLGCALRPA